MIEKQQDPYAKTAAEEAISLLEKCGVDVNEMVKEGNVTKYVYEGYHYFQAEPEAQKILLLATLNKMTKQLRLERDAIGRNKEDEGDRLSDLIDKLYKVKPVLFAEIAKEGRNSGTAVWRSDDDIGKNIWYIYHPEVGQFSFHQQQHDIDHAMQWYTTKEMVFSPEKKRLTTHERHELFTVDTLKSSEAIQDYATISSQGIFTKQEETQPYSKVTQGKAQRLESEKAFPRMA